jgi:hypothetical protein
MQLTLMELLTTSSNYIMLILQSMNVHMLIGDWFSLHDKSHVFVNDFSSSATCEQNLIEFTGEKSIDLIKFSANILILNLFWKR